MGEEEGEEGEGAGLAPMGSESCHDGVIVCVER